jgi:cell division septal protein FtsQ
MDDDRRRVRLRRGAIAGLVVVALAVAAVASTYTSLFAARDIRIDGTGAMPRAELLRLAGLTVRSNVFHLEASAVERRLEHDPRILSATVTTDLPHGVGIAVVRRRPVAVVGNPPAFVGADGVVIGDARPSVDLPSLTVTGGFPASGEELAAAASTAAAMSPSLRRAVDTILVDPDGTIEVRTALGFWADLGDAAELRAKAASLWALLRWVTRRGVAVVSADVSVPGSPTAELERGGVVPTPDA